MDYFDQYEISNICIQEKSQTVPQGANGVAVKKITLEHHRFGLRRTVYRLVLSLGRGQRAYLME